MQVKLAWTASCKQRPAWTAKLQRRARHLAVMHLGQDRTHQDQTLRQSLGVHVCAGSTCITLLTMSSQCSYDSRHWIKCMFFSSTIYSSAHHILGPFSHSYHVSGITWPADSGAVPTQENAKVLGSADQGVSPFISSKLQDIIPMRTTRASVMSLGRSSKSSGERPNIETHKRLKI